MEGKVFVLEVYEDLFDVSTIKVYPSNLYVEIIQEISPFSERVITIKIKSIGNEPFLVKYSKADKNSVAIVFPERMDEIKLVDSDFISEGEREIMMSLLKQKGILNYSFSWKNEPEIFIIGPQDSDVEVKQQQALGSKSFSMVLIYDSVAQLVTVYEKSSQVQTLYLFESYTKILDFMDQVEKKYFFYNKQKYKGDLYSQLKKKKEELPTNALINYVDLLWKLI